jgi:ABC-type dipeptide/oligopeptide/nickel transport system permease subunit
MIEILVVAFFLLALCAALIVLPILVVIKAAQLLFEPAINEVVSTVNEVRDHHWRNADAVGRERMVRTAYGWRVIGRVVGAGALVGGAFVATSSTIGFACCLAAWRMLKPIKQEMHDACAYKSTGQEDEPRYSSGDGAF